MKRFWRSDVLEAGLHKLSKPRPPGGVFSLRQPPAASRDEPFETKSQGRAPRLISNPASPMNAAAARGGCRSDMFHLPLIGNL